MKGVGEYVSEFIGDEDCRGVEGVLDVCGFFGEFSGATLSAKNDIYSRWP